MNKFAIAHGHFIERCKYCNSVIAQCRCPGPKQTLYSVCNECQRKIDRDEPLYPEAEQERSK